MTESSRVGVGSRLEFGLYRFVSRGLALLPERWAHLVAGGLGWFAGSVLRVRRSVVDENLARAFPAESPDWRARVARGSYVHLARESVALLRERAVGAGAVLERVQFQGLEMLIQAMSQGKGAILVTGHLGNWELAGSAVAMAGVPLDAVAMRQKNPLFHEEMTRSRGELGLRVILKSDATRPILRALKEGRAVALLADQNVWAGALWVEFFGTPSATTRGPALLARRTGAPLFLALGIRTAAWPPAYTVTFQPLPVESTDDLEADLHTTTRSYLQALEDWVRRYPQQYFWHHRRWKRTAPKDGGSGTAPPGQGTM
ncbi:MAG: lysophospholipid acyltransferase family protein [Gemmatimonadota bacterium]